MYFELIRDIVFAVVCLIGFNEVYCWITKDDIKEKED